MPGPAHTPSNHARIIRAWGLGYTIQRRSLDDPNVWWNMSGPTAEVSMKFSQNREYRIHPDQEQHFIENHEDVEMPVEPANTTTVSGWVLKGTQDRLLFAFNCPKPDPSFGRPWQDAVLVHAGPPL